MGQPGKREHCSLSDQSERNPEQPQVRQRHRAIRRKRERQSRVTRAGPILANVMDACRDLPVNLVYFHTLKPIDKALIGQFRDTPRKLCVGHAPTGSTRRSPQCRRCACTITDCRTSLHGWYGTVHDIRKRIGLDPPSIRAAAQALLDDRMPATLPLAVAQRTCAEGRAARPTRKPVMFLEPPLSLVTGSCRLHRNPSGQGAARLGGPVPAPDGGA